MQCFSWLCGRAKPMSEDDPAELANSGAQDSESSTTGCAVSAFPLTHTPRSLTLRHCKAITSNFTRGVLGSGSFGEVFLGEWVNGKVVEQVAVKRLKPESFQGQEEWMNEILLLSNLRHSNLIRLLGYCAEGNESLLVYNLCPNGSLADALFAKRMWKQRLLTWRQRVRVVQDVARGLAYLHENGVIHRDFKAANVLLNEDMSACITDFGISRVAGEDTEHVSTRVLGTLGYLDPAYMTTGKLTKASDVYAFGVLLLELLTGQHGATSDEKKLVVTLAPYLRLQPPQVAAFMDGRLLGDYDVEIAKKLAIVAKHCLVDEPEQRPDMSDLVKALLKIKS